MNLFLANSPIYLIGPSAYLPSTVVDNASLIDATRSVYPSQLIAFSTGIKTRHWASKQQACSDLAIASCEQLLTEYPDFKHSIRQLILCTISGDYISPPTSPRILHQLGISKAGAMDLGAACAGFVTGLHTAAALVSATKQNTLLVASEVRSKFLNLDHFGSSVLFGDGASSIGVSHNDNNAEFKLIASASYADGEIHDMISIPAGGSRNPITNKTPLTDSQISVKNSSVLFIKAVQGMSYIAQELLFALDLSHNDIDWLIPHQGNKHLVSSVAKQLNISHEKTAFSVESTGNTSGASNGIALAHLKANKCFKTGQRILLTAAGGGGMSAAALIQVL